MNGSDPTGLLSWLTPVLIAVLVGIIVGFQAVLGPMAALGALVGAVTGIMAFIGWDVGKNLCTVGGMGDIDDALIAGIGGAVAGGLGAGLNPGYLGAALATLAKNLAAWGGASGLGGLISGLIGRFR
ncbi:MAG: hypothetical protein HS102_19290 [Planctomycetia bacterium]|nr:hypothetical protein [Planctomycetia bacterium]